ncbi:conserved hypothetical protein [Gammaproteobacteria bacterium]
MPEVRGQRSEVSGRVWLSPIRASEFEALQRAAAADNHTVVGATHIIKRGSEIVGYGGISSLACLHVWVDSKRVRARESLDLLNLGENLAAGLTGQKTLLVPCANNSPFRPLLPRLGYGFLGESGFFVRDV